MSIKEGGKALGQMANAPLALVLAQVRFSPYLSIAEHIPAIQDALRKSYPAFRHDRIQGVEFGPAPGGPKVTYENAWNFSDASNHEGFVIQQNSLVFIATKYKTYNDFAERHAAILRCFEATVPDVLVERLGMRCVDVVVPNEGELPSQYVVTGLQGCDMDILAADAFESQFAAQWKMGNGVLVFRFSTGVGAPFLPVDLQPLQMATPEIINRAQAAKAPIGLMDFDRIVYHKVAFNASDLSGQFLKMHDDLSQLFKKSRSAHAEKVWNRKQ